MNTATAVRERPILFSGPMVKAILAGQKTQTRRVVKPQPSYDWLRPVVSDGEVFAYCDGPTGVRCPYGKVGDRLWVKEQCWIWGRWQRNGKTATGRQRWRFHPYTKRPAVVYEKPGRTAKRDGSSGWVYRHARFCPRWASRLTLEITDVRVQRLQEISDEDCFAEAAVFDYAEEPQCEFEDLWDSINGKREGAAWSDNPWAWCVSFTTISVPE